MPVNRNALIRYNTIDKCLRNRYRKWTLDDLIDACSEALYEFEGIDKGVSRRTVQMDIQAMRSEKIGYNAPIIVTEKKYYTYEDPNYSISNIPLTDQDLGKLTEVVEILKQFKGFTHFRELSGMVQKLEDKVNTSKTHERSIIDLEKNDNLKGLEFIDPIYQSILKKKCIEITYQSFKARSEQTYIFHPFLLKEHRNRWFVLGSKNGKQHTILLAMDRIIKLEDSDKDTKDFDEELITNYFNDVIGVTVNEGAKPEEIILMATHNNAPYVITKPLHHSQKVIKKTDEGVFLSLFVQHNFELERDILAFGERLKVVSPQRLKSSIKQRLGYATDNYTTELNTKSINTYKSRLDAKGYIIAHNVYGRKSINYIGKILKQYQEDHPELKNNQVYAIRRLFKEIPGLKELCINSNLKKVLNAFGDNLFLTKAIYFDKPPKSNWSVTWHQDIPVNVEQKIETIGYSGWTKKGNVTSVIPPDEILHNTITIRIHLDDTDENNGALKIVPGSHKKRHSNEEIQLITTNSTPVTCEVNSGGIQIMKPLLLHSSSKSTNQKRRRVIHLEFNHLSLKEELKWAEKEMIK